MTSQAHIKHITAKVLKEAEDLKYLEALNHKRTIIFNYRGLDIELQVTSLAEELVLKLACWVKAHAVGTAALPEMKFEVGLFQDMTTNTMLPVDDDLVAEYAAARATLTRVLKAVPTDGTVVVGILKSKYQMLRGIDKTFSLDFMAWIAMHAEGPGLKAVQSRLRTALPTKTDLKTLQQSIQSINLIVTGSVYKFGNAALRSQVDSVREVIATMAAGSPPAIDHMKGSDFMIEVCPRSNSTPWCNKFKCNCAIHLLQLPLMSIGFG